MLKNTFCHLPGIGTITESEMWEAGIHAWEDAERTNRWLTEDRLTLLTQSIRQLDKGNPNYFTELLPSNQHWRIFPEFRKFVAYLDIETTGLHFHRDYITTIALYDGEKILHYVWGENLGEFESDIKRYKVLVTYNGKCFDLPFIGNHLNIYLDQAHLDLRYILKRLGYSGGLKSCEKQLGYNRGELDSVDGQMAVLLWNEFNKTKDRKALDTLLAYNIEDVLILEDLLIFAFNENLKKTRFYKNFRIPSSFKPSNPYKADLATIEKLKTFSISQDSIPSSHSGPTSNFIFNQKEPINLAGIFGEIKRAGQEQKPDSVHKMMVYLGHNNGNVRRLACCALGKIGDASAENGLLKCLNDDKPQVRQYAIKAIANLGGKAAIPHLKAIYKHDYEKDYNRSSAQTAIRMIEDRIKRDTISPPKNNKSSIIKDAISTLKNNVEWEKVHIETFPERSGQYGELEKPIHPELVKGYLTSLKIDSLYSHQAQAINLIRRKSNVVVISKTASGKTMCFNLPIIDHMLSDSSVTAMYLFPTKALAQDQYKTLLTIIEHTSQEIICGVYDGDTPTDVRRRLKQKVQILLSNPDMLHFGILPQHSRWASFFRRLKYIVIDEVHSYRGVFGSHIALIMRRLMRVCSYYGTTPQFICASATIANAKEHAECLIGKPFELVEEDGSPSHKKYFVVWNPPLTDEIYRTKASKTCNQILSELLQSNLKTICFTRSRNLVEVIHSTIQKTCAKDVKRIDAYRGGYLPMERRAIEKRLFNGKTDLVISTNALELGIDIGTLNCCIIVGYPGSIASLWQQAGRAGRTSQESLVVFIAGDEPVDQYFVRNPKALFGATPEHAVIDPQNILLLTQHLRCALYELPITLGDQQYFGDMIFSILSVLVDAQQVIENRNKDISISGVREWTLSNHKSYPAARVNLRSIDANYDILDQKSRKVIGTIDEAGAYGALYLDAIYLHRSRTYQSKELDIVKRMAKVEPVYVDYYTQPICETHIPGMDDIVEDNLWRIVSVCFGDVQVIKRYNAFKKIQIYPNQLLGYGDINLPPLTLKTEALSIKIPEELQNEAEVYGPEFLNSGLIGVAQLFLSMMTLHVMCDSRDVDAWVDFNPMTIYIYDQVEDGAGFAERAYDLIETIMNAGFQLLMECPCSKGCPSCVIYKGNNKDMEDHYDFPKESAKFMLHALLEKPPYEPKTDTVSRLSDKEMPLPSAQTLSSRELKKVQKALKYFYEIGDRIETPLGPGVIVDISGDKCLIQLKDQVSCIWESFSNLL
ncbi:MAG: ribonuclease H-like domain-containing protein [Deltaproteobacteria bacterium]|nr:ribonuclease H-like domain-containing protein [Deltaproteobacteria bacterium]